MDRPHHGERLQRRALRSGFQGTRSRWTICPTVAPEEPDTGVTDAVMMLPQKYREAIYLY